MVPTTTTCEATHTSGKREGPRSPAQAAWDSDAEGGVHAPALREATNAGSTKQRAAPPNLLPRRFPHSGRGLATSQAMRVTQADGCAAWQGRSDSAGALLIAASPLPSQATNHKIHDVARDKRPLTTSPPLDPPPPTLLDFFYRLRHAAACQQNDRAARRHKHRKQHIFRVRCFHIIFDGSSLPSPAKAAPRTPVGGTTLRGVDRHRVNLGGVQEVDAGLVHGVIELLVRLGLSVLLAKRHRAQAALCGAKRQHRQTHDGVTSAADLVFL
eukprot:366102-Chlamydomonas_euryale.AAC.15